MVPGAGLWLAVAVGLVATLAMALLHGASCRDRAALPSASAAAAVTRTAAAAATAAAASIAALTIRATRQRILPPPRLPAAGLVISPRILPAPVAARA